MMECNEILMGVGLAVLEEDKASGFSACRRFPTMTIDSQDRHLWGLTILENL